MANDADKAEFSALTYKALPWIAAIAFFMQTLDTSILNTALPTIAHDLNESPLNMESAVICYALTLALFIPISGFLSDRFGTRNIFISALALFSIGSLCSAASTTLLLLDVSRVIQGIGGAMMVPVSRLVLIKVYDRKEFLYALNTSTLFGLIGPFMGPLLGGYLVEKASWHWIFLINVPIGIIGILFSLKLVPNLKGEKVPLDIVGFTMISLAFILSTLSLQLVSDGISFIWSGVIFVVSIILAIAYINYARDSKHKPNKNVLFPLEIFRIRTLRLGLLGNFLSRLGTQSIPFLIPLLLQLVYGYSAIESGLMLMPIAIASMIMKGIIPKILTNFGYRNSLSYSTVIVGVIIMCLALFNEQSSALLMATVLFFMGFVNSLRLTAMSSITLADLYGEQTSSGNSLLAVSQQLAISFGVALGSLLIRVFQFDSPLLNMSMMNAFRGTFFVLGLITCLSFISFYRLSADDGKNLTER